MLGGIDAFTSGLHRWNDDTLARAQHLFSRARALGAPDALWSYWLGTTLFYRASQAMFGPEEARSRDSAAVHGDGALGVLRPCVSGSAMRGECLAMKGTLYGQRIAANPLQALHLGPLIVELRAEALEADSLNPRVQHLLGMNYYYAPGLFGGGPRRALPFFLAADSLFASRPAPANALAPRWGRAVNASFIGRAYDKVGDRPKAIAWLERALAMNPHDWIARRRLEELTYGPQSSWNEPARDED